MALTQVDFYVLRTPADGGRFQLACRLAEKAWRQGHRVLIGTDSESQALHVDRLLWTFRDQSFVPHGLLGRVDPMLNPVLVTSGEDAGEEHDVLINLAEQVPAFFSRFLRVAECVDTDPAVRAASRLRFRYYRDHGYPLNTVEVS